MAGASETLHEPSDRLSEETLDRHRAIVSLMEELEAVDWYDQRAEATRDESLRAILEHNRDEEKEHAVMALEWLRRRDAKLDAELRERLFTSGAIHAEGHEDGGSDGPEAAGDGSLGIGSLKEVRS